MEQAMQIRNQFETYTQETAFGWIKAIARAGLRHDRSPDDPMTDDA
jgi:hypothetical protein